MTDALSTLLQALHTDPGDATAWLALADALEEEGQSTRAELVRLSCALRTLDLDGRRQFNEARLRSLLAAGVRPCVPLLTNSIGMRLALVPAGDFWMGSPEGEPHRDPDEGPRHPATISRPVYLGIFTVTQAQYRAVTGHNPSFFSPEGGGAGGVVGLDTDSFPVEQVSWDDCVEFCARLSSLPEERRAKRSYRLPSEAEWEYACRAGTSTTFHFGNDLSSRDANFDGNHPYGEGEKGRYLTRPSAVGSYRPNAFGLFDMHGNVWEWCADWFAADYYGHSPRSDPRGPEDGNYRLLRGGSWKNDGFYLRAAHRGWSTADERIGFRVVLEHPAG